MRVTGLDHLVLVVADARRSLAWYGELGLVPERFEEWERGEAPFVSLRVDATTVIDLVEPGGEHPGPAGAGSVASADGGSGVSAGGGSGVSAGPGRNLDHLCLVLEPGTDLDELVASGRFDVVAGRRRLWGARGWGEGIYVRDPDGNVVELRVYPLA